MHVTPPLLFSGIEQKIGTYPCRVAPSGVAMSEDGVRTEKCKKYQVTALSTQHCGLGGCVAATCDAAARSLFRVSFDLFLFRRLV